MIDSVHSYVGLGTKNSEGKLLKFITQKKRSIQVRQKFKD